MLRRLSVLREGGGGEVLQSPEQDLQGEKAERMLGGWMMVGCASVCYILTLLCFRPAGRRHVVVGELHSLRLR